MRPAISDFVRVCAAAAPLPDPVYEFGAFIVPGQESISNLRSYFPGRAYVGADMREGPGVDVLLNLHHVDLPDASVGTVLLMDTLEHVEYPHKAMDEVYRILKPDGAVVMSSVMDFPIHAYPSDYWRFTPEAFRSLLKPFRHVVVESLGRSEFPHTVVGVGFKGEVAATALKSFQAAVDGWRDQWQGRVFLGWKEVVRRLTPPMILEWGLRHRG